jgi:hypothetical protein
MLGINACCGATLQINRLLNEFLKSIYSKAKVNLGSFVTQSPFQK